MKTIRLKQVTWEELTKLPIGSQYFYKYVKDNIIHRGIYNPHFPPFDDNPSFEFFILDESPDPLELLEELSRNNVPFLIGHNEVFDQRNAVYYELENGVEVEFESNSHAESINLIYAKAKELHPELDWKY